MKITRDTLRLYAVTDRSWEGKLSLYEQAELALAGGVTALQLREKVADRSSFLEEAARFKVITAKYGVPLIINDSVEVAVLSGADGVHLGQDDMPPSEARRILGKDKIIGVSAHNIAEALAAQAAGADYLGVGAVFGSATKTNVCEMTYQTLKSICAAVQIPVVAIGGITVENIYKLAGSGIAGVAAVSAIFASGNIKNAAKQMYAASSDVCGI